MPREKTSRQSKFERGSHNLVLIESKPEQRCEQGLCLEGSRLPLEISLRSLAVYQGKGEQGEHARTAQKQGTKAGMNSTAHESTSI